MSRYKALGRWPLILSILLVLSAIGWFLGMSPQPQPAEAPAQAETGSAGNRLLPEAGAAAPAETPATQVAQFPAEPAPADGRSIPEQERVPGHPSEPLIAGSVLVREHWSAADALGNRERSAIYRTDLFKYPMLRVVEKWSGKTGDMVSRKVMVADHLLVAPRPGVDAAEFEKRISAEGFTMAGPVGESSMLVSFDTRGDDPAELPRRIDALGQLVEYAEPDYLVWHCAEPNDPSFADNQLWGLKNPGGVNGYTQGADIDAPAGWAVRNDASSVVVAVTDTGVAYNHEDLAPNMWTNPAEIPGNGMDDDGNGLIDDVFGYNAYDGNGDPMDLQGHGTHCAGTIGARGDNGVGITGVAWNVRLMAGKFLGPNGGTTSDAITVIEYALKNGADIISASWGGGGYSQALKNAIAACANAGIPFVAAAGNSGTNNDSLPHYPSSFDLPNIVAVAATNANDELTGFSCFGRNSVDIAAPGWQIWSTYIGGTSSYRFLHGTSMATPHVSGALALARAEFPTAGVDELIDRLYRSVDTKAALDGKVATAGRLNLYRLLTDNGTYLPNDKFNEAFVLTGDFATWSGGNHAATREADESSYSPAAGSRTLWFAWQAPFDGFAAVTTASLGAGQRVVVFSGDARSSLKVVYDSGMPSAGDPETVARFLAEAGKHYRIVTAGDSADGELFSLKMELIASNDLLSGAFTLEGEEFETAGSNRGATAQPFETAAPHAGVGAGHSVWFRWTAPVSGPFSLNTEGSDTDTVVAVYTGNPANPADFTTIGANDDVSGMLRWSRVDFDAVEGSSYYIAVDTAMGGVPGGFVLRGTAPAAPFIASQPVDIEVPFGGRAVFSVGAEGTPPLRYQWFRDDEALPGAWENTLIIDPVTEAALGVYHVVVGNSYGIATSDAVQLAELRAAPGIIWSTGDLAVLAGQDAALGVQAAGSDPLSYSWTKDGVELSGQDQSSLQLANVTETGKGIYVCTVSNDRGTATATMVLTVVTSPFDSFTAVRESAPNSPIASISVIDGKCYAVASERIMVSEDGRAWLPWQLPGGFDGTALAKHNGKWYCAGYRVDGKFSMAISHDGVTWDEPVEITGLTPPYGGPTPFTKMVSISGRLVAAETPRVVSGTWYAAAVYHSTNGINWSRAQRRNLSDTLVDLSIKCRFEMWGGKLYAPGDGTISSVLVSDDGITWQESLLPVDGSGTSYQGGKAIGTFGDKLQIICTRGSYSTTDGINWTMDGSFTDNDGYFGRQVVSTGNDVYSFTTWNGSATYRRGPSTTTWTNFVANPPGRIFSAAVEFDGAVIYGTTTGMLRRIDSPEDFTGTPEAVYPLSRIEFLNDEFLAYRPGSNPNVTSPGPVLISGDGRRWRAGKSFSSAADHLETNPVATVFLGGRYFGGSNSGEAAGLVPAAMTAAGLPAGVVGARAAATDGTRWLVIGSMQDVYFVSLDGSEWTPHQATGLYATRNAELVHFNDKWFLTNRDASTPALYRSEDGITWSTVPGVPCRTLTVFDGKLRALNINGATLYESVDGETWSSFATGITVGTTKTVGSTTVTASRLLVFDGKLITLVGESLSGRKFAFFSEDARTWFRGQAPYTLQDLAVGNGMLVGVTSNGSVLVSGSTGAGGAAPLVNINYPTHKSTHVNGTMVEIRGTAVDPEGQAVATECIVDGVSIGSSTAGQFRFQFRASNPGGHVVSVRSRDTAAIVGSDEIKVFASQPQLRNDFESEEGISRLPQVAWTSFGGRAYVAGQYSLYRTRDDGSWESVLLPSLPGAITNLVSGNGALIVQTASASFVTRDGVVWTQLSQPRGGIIAFQGGSFVASLYDSYYGYTQTVFSQDGLSWTFGSRPFSSGNWSPSRPTITPGGSLLVTPPYRSIDGGTNWIPMPEFGSANSLNLQFATAFGEVFAGLSDGRVLRSTDDGRSWQQVAQFDPLPTGHHVRIALHAGRLFWGGGGYWLAGSDNGSSWRLLENEPLQSSHVMRFDGRFVGFGRSGMLWSANGYVWQPAKAGPQNPARDMLADNGDALLLGDTNGGLWRATDGRTWKQTMPGKPLSVAPASTINTIGGTRLRVGNTTVIGGSENNSHFNTYLWYSENGGLDWKSGSFHGGVFSGVTIAKMWSNGSVAFAATSRIMPEGNTLAGLWRSTDGRDWQQLWTWPGVGVADMQFHNNEWWALGTDGSLRRSTDSGNSWSADMRPEGLLGGRLLIRFDGAWIVIGTQAADLKGPNFVYVSTDGQTWTEHAAPGGETQWSILAYAANANTLVVTSSTRKVYTATDRNLDWINTATISSGTGIQPIEWIGGKFVIAGRLVSNDGTTWTEPTKIGSYIPTPAVFFKGVYVSFPTYFSMTAYWSTDGLNWTISTGGALFRNQPVFAVESNALRVRDDSGAVWETTDGKAWTRVRDGVADISNTGFARRIISYGDRLLATGTEGLLLYSDDDGRSWQQGLLDGRPMSAKMSEREIKTSPTEVLAIYSVNTNVDPPVTRHFRSADGRAWTEMQDMAALNVLDYAWADGIWLAIRSDGSLLRSTDGGVSWESAGSIPDIRIAARLNHFQGHWVAAGIAATPATGSAPIQIHTSADGITWIHRADTGLSSNASRDISQFFTGHGYLHYGIQPTPNSTGQLRSADAITWAPMIKGGSTNAPDGSSRKASWYLPVADGYIAFDSVFTTSTNYYWTAPVEGGEWKFIPLLQNQIRWLGTPDGQRLFLFGQGIIKEWTTEDLDLTISDPAPVVVGVGDQVDVSATLRNLGSAAMTDPIRIDAWLSTDRFFGDGNDIYVGSTSWAGAVPDPGEAASQALSFTLPNTVRPGSHYLILEMNLPASFREANRANNVAITGTTVVTIPQRRLQVKTEGNGTINADQNAEYHPHGARIAFVATPGKGARFAGWGGDAFGSLSATLVIMDADKNVEANFISTAALTVFTRGGGTVRQTADDGIYVAGTMAGLTAEPLPGWSFSGWSGALTGNESAESILMDSNKVVTARFSLGFDAWKNQKFGAAELADPSISGDDADADGDGLANWREWLRGSDPKNRNSHGQSAMRREGRWIVMNYTRLENMPAGHGVRASASSDLSDWSVPLDERVVGSANGVETIEARVDVTEMPRVFLRIGDTRPQP